MFHRPRVDDYSKPIRIMNKISLPKVRGEITYLPKKSILRPGSIIGEKDTVRGSDLFEQIVPEESEDISFTLTDIPDVEDTSFKDEKRDQKTLEKTFKLKTLLKNLTKKEDVVSLWKSIKNNFKYPLEKQKIKDILDDDTFIYRMLQEPLVSITPEGKTGTLFKNPKTGDWNFISPTTGQRIKQNGSAHKNLMKGVEYKGEYIKVDKKGDVIIREPIKSDFFMQAIDVDGPDEVNTF